MFGAPDKKLGFGFMRLPMQGDEVDIPTVCGMVDEFLAAGFRYFDTAHGYHDGKSEQAVRAALTSRHPRQSYILANKLSPPFFEKEADILPLFQRQLDICGVDYFDMYLMHAQSAGRFEFYKSCRAYETAFRLREQGRVRRVGISFHDTAEVLERILTEYPDLDFVQLQFNYLDYDDPQVQSRACYEVCRRHDTPVVVMEPVKGGRLASLPADAAAELAAVTTDSPAAFALRFAAEHEGVKMVLSGMSSPEQLRENIAVMSRPAPLTDAERQALPALRRKLLAHQLVQCTGCSYCTAGCPKGIAIPRRLAALNDRLEQKPQAAAVYAALPGAPASACIGCGQCEKACPQKLPIPALLARAAREFE